MFDEARKLGRRLTTLLGELEFSTQVRTRLDDPALEIRAAREIDDWVGATICENLHRKDLAIYLEAVLLKAETEVLMTSWKGARWSLSLCNHLREWRMTCHRFPVGPRTSASASHAFQAVLPTSSESVSRGSGR